MVFTGTNRRRVTSMVWAPEKISIAAPMAGRINYEILRDHARGVTLAHRYDELGNLVELGSGT